ncbi:sensor histidine kinase [Cohnella luojiensis]|nr:sensor histidine kinase [Cohnella luojiensis]
MRYFQEMSLKLKFNLLMLSLFLIIVVMGMLWYKTSANAIENNAIDYTKQIVEQVNSHLDTYFVDIQELTFPMLANPLTQQFMDYSNNDHYRRYELSKAIDKKLFTPILINRENIHSISLISDQSIASSSRSFISAEERYADYISRIPSPGKYQIMGRETILSTNVIAMALRFLDASKQKATGLLIVDLKLNEIIRICKSVKLGRTGFMWIADANGNLLYHPDEELMKQRALPEYVPESLPKESGSKVVDSPEGKKLVLFNYSAKTNLVLVSEVPYRELNAPLVRFSLISILIVIVLMLALSLLIVGLIVHPLTNSLLLLKKLMFRAERGDLDAKAPENKTNEIGSLFLSFNRMVSEIKQLIELVRHARLKEKEMEVKQKESQLRYMQSQINPHFLYNTLEVVNSNAIVEGNFKISKMIVSISEIFRYSVGNPGDRVTLRQEVEHTDFYLEIQKERFGSLETEVSIGEPGMTAVPAVRLMLQPIVENSFKHGYENHRMKPGYLSIAGRTTPDGYEILVSDRGGGMDAAIMERYNALFSQASQEESGEHQHIGLWNVHNRIRMTFGESYGLHIVQSNKTGTVIAIRLPVMTDNL